MHDCVYLDYQMELKQYVSTLTEYSIRKAADELHEDQNQTLGSLQTFITWIQDQNWLKTTLGK